MPGFTQCPELHGGPQALQGCLGSDRLARGRVVAQDEPLARQDIASVTEGVHRPPPH